MLRLIALVVLLAVAGILVLAASRPDTFRIVRSTVVSASPERIFPYLNDLHLFRLWSPFEHKDPGMERAFSGPLSGPGAIYEFAGNNQIGAGRLTISGTAPPTSVTMRLDMHRPMAASNVVTFSLEPAGGGTRVTWDMQGPAPFLSKLIHLFINMERLVGNDFEAGLASLKALAERPQAALPDATETRHDGQ
jgi:hypothetical protein